MCCCFTILIFFFFFFFQAEDGIRDGHVTGVQTCALPISRQQEPWLSFPGELSQGSCWRGIPAGTYEGGPSAGPSSGESRSEERRVGKECRSRGATDE